jgi:hypothetical protein
MNSSARRPGAAASSLAVARISSSVASEQVDLLGGERRAVAVHQPLAGAGVLQAKVGQQRYYFGSRGHGGVLSVGAVAGGRRLPVVPVLAVSAGAVQRPSGEPAPLVDLAAQRANNGRAGQVPLSG